MAFASLQGKILLLVLPLLAYLMASVFFYDPTPQLEIVRDLTRSRISVGETVEISLTVRNTGQTLANFQIQDELAEAHPVVEGETSWSGTLFAGQTQTIKYKVRPGRGKAEAQQVLVSYTDPLGLVVRKEQHELAVYLTVEPQIEQVDPPVIRPRNTLVYAGNIRARTPGSGVEFFGVRDFQPGDSRRHINWRLSSKGNQRMYTNAFEQERVADVGIILDARERSEFKMGEATLFDYAVQAAGALANAYSEAGNRVGLLQYGRLISWTFPGYGKQQRLRILQALAGAKSGDSQVFDNLRNIPTQLFPRNSQLVFISPIWKDDIDMVTRLKGMGYNVLVVSPNPISYEKQFISEDNINPQGEALAALERKLLLRQIRNAGADVIDWDIAEPLAHALRRYQRVMR